MPNRHNVCYKVQKYRFPYYTATFDPEQPQFHYQLLFSYSHCPISTATTHIGSSCACSGGQNRFGLVLVHGLGQSKAVPVSHPKPIMPTFGAVVTVTVMAMGL